MNNLQSRIQVVAEVEDPETAGEQMAVDERETQCDVDTKELRNMDTDLLIEVFKYVPQQTLLEVMSVSQRWGECVRDGSNSLWRQVAVFRWWWFDRNMKYRMVFKLLRNAEEVRFMKHKRYDIPVCIAEVFGQNLRCIELPQNIKAVTPAFFRTLLSNSPELRCLLVKGEPKDYDVFQISHPKLEFLELKCELVRPLEINCPNLTHLSTLGDVRDASVRDPGHGYISFRDRIFQVPSIHCPQLTTMCLSPLHCAEGVLESIAAHAPNVTSLHSYSRFDSPFMDSTFFHSLRSLTLKTLANDPLLGWRALHAYCPDLESLCLHGFRAFESGMCKLVHQGLKSLEIIDGTRLQLQLTCPGLENVHIESLKITPAFFENLNGSCPRLKRLRLRWYHKLPGENKGGDKEDEVFNLFHETLQELEVGCEFLSTSEPPLNISCPQLTKLAVRNEKFWERNLSSLNLPNLTTLELYHCRYTQHSPSVLSTLPRLECLRLLETPNYCESWAEVEVERSLLPNLVIEKILAIES